MHTPCRKPMCPRRLSCAGMRDYAPERLQLAAWLLLAEILPDRTGGIHLVVAAHSVATSGGITSGLTLIAAGLWLPSPGSYQRHHGNSTSHNTHSCPCRPFGAPECRWQTLAAGATEPR